MTDNLKYDLLIWLVHFKLSRYHVPVALVALVTVALSK